MYDDIDDIPYAINYNKPILFGMENSHHFQEYSTGETRYFDRNNRLHRIDGPACEDGLMESRNKWFIHGREIRLPDWCPYYMNEKIYRKIDKAIIVKIVMTVDREYGLILDTIYEALEKEKAEKAKKVLPTARIIKIK